MKRVRVELADESPVREVSMFGGRSFMVAEKLAVCALKDGALLVRVSADDHDALTERPGAEQAEMGKGRTMGPGWIRVAAEALEDDEGLSFWVGEALAYRRSRG
ncbi:MAG: TfoX/Sxy family protein [Aeromicrobium sp.]|uniref:TfoX/Sxy family protein n=1 Tax=Aeromicrobium sp. TaxID=1871063 RepID=UPI0039E6621F